VGGVENVWDGGKILSFMSMNEEALCVCKNSSKIGLKV
jgi:hypothetical protein